MKPHVKTPSLPREPSVFSKEIKVRKIRALDAKVVASLLADLGYPATPAQARRRLATLLVDDADLLLVAFAGKTPAGLCSFHRIPLLHEDGYVGRITSFVVASAHRKRGIGRALVSALERHAWTHGCARIEVASGDRRSSAYAFYDRLGYALDCRRFLKRRPS